MKILIVGPSPNATGGIQKVFGAMGAYLAAVPGVEVGMLDEVAAKRRPGDGRSSRAELVRGSVRLMSAFRERMAEDRPDVVHLNAAYGRSLLEKAMLALVASRSGIPAVVHMHGSRMDEEFPSMERWRSAFLRRALSPPNHTVVLSERSRRIFLDRFPGLPATVLPNAVYAVDRPPGPGSNPRHLGFLGALIGRKGELDLIRAMSLTDSPCDLVIAGDGPGRAEAESLAESLGLRNRVTFLGNVGGPAKDTFFRSIDLLCLPSHAENFPVALLEAMSHGLPVVSTTVAGIPEMVADGEHGWLVAPADIPALASAISDALGHPDELRRRGPTGPAAHRGAIHLGPRSDPRWVDLYSIIGRRNSDGDGGKAWGLAMRLDDEVEAIRGRYARRIRGERPGIYDPLDRYVSRTRQERERSLNRWLRESKLGPVSEARVLEIGCGIGANLLDLIRLGFRPANLAGNDLLPDRVAQARRRLPAEVAVLLGDATALDLDGESFDVVLQSTVFSSILDDAFQERLAARMWDLARPGGGILWYDATWDNPSNPDFRGVPVPRIRRLFPHGIVRSWRITLAPPIGRRLCRVWPPLYHVANTVPFLNSHVLCWIRKPSRRSSLIDPAVRTSRSSVGVGYAHHARPVAAGNGGHSPPYKEHNTVREPLQR